MSVGQIHTLESTKIKAVFTEDASYGLVLNSITNIVDGATMSFVSGPPCRLITRAVSPTDTFTTHDLSTATAIVVNPVIRYAYHWEITCRYVLDNIDGSSSDMELLYRARIYDASPDRISFEVIPTPVNNGLVNRAVFWLAPTLIAIAKFTSEHYLSPISGGLATRDSANLTGNGTTYRFNTDVGFEPETKASSESDSMELMYPGKASSALSAYGDRSSGYTIYVHDNLGFMPRRIIDSRSGSTIKLEHECLVEDAITAQNATGMDDPIGTYSSYVRVFKGKGHDIGEDVGIDYRRWLETSSEGNAVLVGKPGDRTDVKQRFDPAIWLEWSGEDDDGSESLNDNVTAELKVALPTIGTQPLSHRSLTFNEFNQQTSSSTHLGTIGDAFPDLFDLKIDASRLAEAAAVEADTSPAFMASTVNFRRPQVYDGGGYWASDDMNGSRVKNHLEAADVGYSSVDSLLSFTKTVSASVVSGAFTKITLSAGAFTPGLFNLFSTYGLTTAGVNHASHQNHNGWLKRDNNSYAFVIERQVQADFEAASPIIYVAGDVTATILAGHTLNIYFGGDHYIPGHLTASSSLCGFADEIGSSSGSELLGWGVRFIDRLTTLQPLCKSVVLNGLSENLICWNGHGGPYSHYHGGNHCVAGLRAILSRARALMTSAQFIADYGPADWQVSVIDGHSNTFRSRLLTTSAGSWGQSQFFAFAWGKWARFGYFENSGSGHVSNASAATYATVYEGANKLEYQQAIVADWISGKLPTLGVVPLSAQQIGTTPDGVPAFTPFNHATKGLTLSTSIASMIKRLVVAGDHFDSAWATGKRLASLQPISSTVISSPSTGVVTGHNVGVDERGLAGRTAIRHSFVADPANPRRLIAFFVNDDVQRRGASYLFDPADYSSDVMFPSGGYRITETTFEDGVAVGRTVSFRGGEFGFAVSLDAGGVMAISFDFSDDMRFVYSYDDEADLKEVPFDATGNKVRIDDIHGNGERFRFGFVSDSPDTGFKASSITLRVFSQGRSEST